MVVHAWNPRTWRVEEWEFEVILSYIASLRSAWAIFYDLVRKTNKQKTGHRQERKMEDRRKGSLGTSDPSAALVFTFFSGPQYQLSVHKRTSSDQWRTLAQAGPVQWHTLHSRSPGTAVSRQASLSTPSSRTRPRSQNHGSSLYHICAGKPERVILHRSFLLAQTGSQQCRRPGPGALSPC